MISETDVRLVGGATPYTGQFQIRHKGQWQTVCESAIDNKTATVVCNMLGFPRGLVSRVHCILSLIISSTSFIPIFIVDLQVVIFGNGWHQLNC